MSKFVYLFSALLVLLLAGCGGGGGGGGGSSSGLPTTIKLVSGETRGYLLDGGRFALLVPQGTVGSDTLVNVSKPASVPNDALYVSNTAVTFSNATLANPVNLRIRINPSDIPAGGSKSNLRLFKLEDNMWVEIAGSSVDTDLNTVSGDIASFGTFGVRLKS